MQGCLPCHASITRVHTLTQHTHSLFFIHTLPIHTFTHTLAQRLAPTHAQSHIHPPTYMHPHTHAHIRMHTYACTHTHAHIRTHAILLDTHLKSRLLSVPWLCVSSITGPNILFMKSLASGVDGSGIVPSFNPSSTDTWGEGG